MRKLKSAELHRIDVQSYKKAAKTPLIIVLADVRSRHNVGSVFRTADAFLIQKIYLCGITATPPHRNIQKTALGATESVDWAFAPSAAALITELKADGVRVVAVEQLEDATPLPVYQPDLDRPTALIFGHEVKGISQALVDLCEAGIEIPQFGTKHSLNIAVAVGVVLWDLFSKMQRP